MRTRRSASTPAFFQLGKDHIKINANDDDDDDDYA